MSFLGKKFGRKPNKKNKNISAEPAAEQSKPTAQVSEVSMTKGPVNQAPDHGTKEASVSPATDFTAQGSSSATLNSDITHYMMDLQTFLEKAREIHEGYYIAAMTDQYLVGDWNTDENKQVMVEEKIVGKKLLELRIFDRLPQKRGSGKGQVWARQGREYKLFRSDISQKDFVCRIIDDSGNCDEIDTYDEWQYLDIDTSAYKGKGCTENGTVRTTGGGEFVFPLLNGNSDRPGEKALVGIRYYLGRYEKTGQARVIDWRVIGFLNDSEEY